MNSAFGNRVSATIEERALDWWRTSLLEGDRGNRARLRRCHTPLDAVAVPSAISLSRRLGRVPAPTDPVWKQRGFERALGLAIVLASVKQNNQIPLLRSLGWEKFPYDQKETDVTSGRPKLSELRFKRLLQTEGEDELIAAFGRLVQLADGATDVAALTRVYLHWDDDRTKRDLALTYYRAETRGLDARE
jgi:CRISPR type I-E-associated protein CasB/Cse2